MKLNSVTAGKSYVVIIHTSSSEAFHFSVINTDQRIFPSVLDLSNNCGTENKGFDSSTNT